MTTLSTNRALPLRHLLRPRNDQLFPRASLSLESFPGASLPDEQGVPRKAAWAPGWGTREEGAPLVDDEPAESVAVLGEPALDRYELARVAHVREEEKSLVVVVRAPAYQLAAVRMRTCEADVSVGRDGGFALLDAGVEVGLVELVGGAERG